MKTKTELTFVDGERQVVFPVGTALHPATKQTVEAISCKRRAEELRKQNGIEYAVVMLAGRERILPNEVIDQ